MMLYSGSKRFRSACSANIRLVRQILRLVESKESSPVDEEEIKIKMDDGVDTSFVSEGIDLFVELWEAQSSFWDPE